MKTQRYLIPPPMTKHALVFGLRWRDFFVLIGMVCTIIFVVANADNLRLLYLFAAPCVYAILAYTPTGQPSNGFAVFSIAWQFCRTPQRYMSVRRKDQSLKEGVENETDR